MVNYLLYTLQVLVLTLGVVAVCGLAVRLCSRLFGLLLGHGSLAVFDVTSIIGTPIHELGHAVMCPLFGHKILRAKLWSPGAKNGTYGFVEHTYNRKNPWAVLGNLFIGLGPIFSGLGVMVLMLWLCYPTQWSNYLASSQALVAAGAAPADLFGEVVALLLSLPAAFAEGWLLPTVALVVILPVSLHITLSAADIKGSLGALPIYLLLTVLFSTVTFLLDVSAPIVSALYLWNLRLLSLFCVVIAFAAVWVVLAIVIRLIRAIISIF